MKFKSFSVVLLASLFCGAVSSQASGFDVSAQINIFGSNAKDKVKENAYCDLAFIEHLITTKYAPLSWKKFLFDWNLDQEVDRCKVKILLQESLTTKYCQSVLADFLNSLNDYHAGVVFFGTEKAYLPFELKMSNSGRVFVVSVSKTATSLMVGDEIIEIDGVPIPQVIESVRKGRGSLADYSAAVRDLTFRSSSLGQFVPKGLVTVKVKRASGLTRSVMERWRYTPENITDFSLVCPLAPKEVTIKSAIFPARKNEGRKSTVFSSTMMPYFWDEVKSNIKMTDRSSNFTLGDRDGFLPNLGSPIWQANRDGPYRAYIFVTTDNEGKEHKVGYIRISTYLWSDLSTGGEGVSEPWRDFADIITKMNHETDMLIVDQLNNPGGSVFYLYGLMSMLTNKPLETPKHRLVLTQEDVSSATEWLELLEDVYTDEQAILALGEDMEGLCIDVRSAEALRSYSRTVLSEWQNGHYDLTSPVALLGFDYIYPHPTVNYEKPIVALINEDNYSCADLFAAVLKDNERGVLIGKTTAGAGGFVYEVYFPNRSGIKRCSLTGSLAVRGDGSFIENIGVSPQIELGFTDRDLQMGKFADYTYSVMAVVKDMLTQKTEEQSNLESPPDNSESIDEEEYMETESADA